MARVRQRSERNRSYDGCWYYETEDKKDKIYYCKYRDENGKQVTAKCGQWSRGYTLYKCSLKRAELLNGTAKTNQQIRQDRAKESMLKIDYLYENYLEKNQDKGREDSRFDKWIKPYWQGKVITQAKNADLKNYRVWLESQISAKGGPLCPQSVKHCLAMFRRIVMMAVKTNDDFRPQISDFAIPVVKNETTEELTTEQVNKLIHILETDTVNRAVCDMMLLIFYTGMRRGEVLKLQWQHVLFKKKEILLKNPKGGTDVVIPMSTKAKAVLQHQLKTSMYVFPGCKGKRRRHIDKQARRIRDLAGLPKDFRPLHGLRHHFGTELAAKGIPIHIISELLGHKGIEITMRYVKARDEQKRKAVELMNTGG